MSAKERAFAALDAAAKDLKETIIAAAIRLAQDDSAYRSAVCTLLQKTAAEAEDMSDEEIEKRARALFRRETMPRGFLGTPLPYLFALQELRRAACERKNRESHEN